MCLKRTFLILSIVLITMSSFNIPQQEKVVFFGDSITELGIKEGGYVDLLKKDPFYSNWDLVGKGISGNKVYDLYLRLDKDVIQLKPTHVVVFIGVNDVWHKSLLGTGTDYDKFIKFYQAIIDEIKASGAEAILVTPAVIGELKGASNPMDKDLDKYSEAIRNLALKNNTKICDLRKIFLTYIEEHNTQNNSKNVLTYDGVHLNAQGNALVAREFSSIIK